MPDHNSKGHSLTQMMYICNSRGLHARASARFVRTAEMFKANIEVTRDGVTVGGTSIMGLMMLAAGPGTKILVKASGIEARQAMDALAQLIDCGFDEDNEGEKKGVAF